ncbi:MAG: hypothetical protein JWP94_1562 [Mucilaginibacter sp.]|jgi:hypothetical protein|nr:hypothetical protein [Mucilaginibacter sp.]
MKLLVAVETALLCEIYKKVYVYLIYNFET